MPNIINPSSVNIRKLDLIGATGTFDLIDNFIELSVYENIFQPALTAHITLTDSFNFAAKLPIVGEETLDIIFSLGGTDDDDATIFLPPMHVNDISSRFMSKPKSQQYSLELVSEQFMNNAHSTISKSYRGKTIQQIVEDIYSSHLDDEHKNSNGFWYSTVPNISVADLDGDGDLDVIRMMVQCLYAGAAMQIEENIGDGKFKTALYSEHCSGPNSKAVWPRAEGNEYNCWSDDFKFGDFNKDGLIDIVIDRNHSPSQGAEEFGNVITGGAIYMSTGKFTYDILWPSPLGRGAGGHGDKGYPLIEIEIKKQPKVVAKVLPSDEELEVQQSVEDEIAAFEAELAAELGQ